MTAPHDYERAHAVIAAIDSMINHYNAAILEQNQSARPDTDLIERFREERRDCLTDIDAAYDATPAQLAGLEAHYAARLRAIGRT